MANASGACMRCVHVCCAFFFLFRSIFRCFFFIFIFLHCVSFGFGMLVYIFSRHAANRNRLSIHTCVYGRDALHCVRRFV